MAYCIWIQCAPADGTGPYPGFIYATVTGDDQNPPPVGSNVIQFSVPPDTETFGMEVDLSGDVPVLIPARADPPPTIIPVNMFIIRFQSNELLAIMTSADTSVKQFATNILENTEIDLNDPTVQAGANYLAQIGILTSDRATAILTP